MKIWQVDAFTTQVFRGNPAGVCVLEQPAGPAWMQALAAEMNLSETAYVYPKSDGYNLRWFTPRVEVDLCGHATLAAAHVLWSEGLLDSETQARFFTRSGLLTARRKQDDWIELDFPETPPEETAAPDGLAEALGVEPKYVGRGKFDYLIEVGSEDLVRGLAPNFSLLEKIEARGIIVTSRADSPEFDFVSRFFAPTVGISEDPVTGSAHCCLGSYWKARLKREKMIAYQASPRGGLLRLRVGQGRVYISGQAVTVFRAELTRSAAGD